MLASEQKGNVHSLISNHNSELGCVSCREEELSLGNAMHKGRAALERLDEMAQQQQNCSLASQQAEIPIDFSCELSSVMSDIHAGQV